MRSIKNHVNKRFAQTTTELAVFGAVLIFVIGMIIRQSMGFGYQQNQNLKAMRMAMTESYKFSKGLKGGGGPDGDTSRNYANVIIIEDRLTVDGGKYAGIDRAPQAAQMSASHTRNLFQPVEAGETYQQPVLDLFINGKYVALSTAKLKTVSVGLGSFVYEKVPNIRGSSYNAGAGGGGTFHPFDLDRNGSVDVDPVDRVDFSWQWRKLSPGAVQAGSSVDVDGDLKEEQIIDVIAPGVFLVFDYQEGDIDLSFDSYDFSQGRVPGGLTNEVYIFTRTESSQNGTGTYLRIEEGKLFNENKYVRSVQRKDTIDLISRKIRLTNDSGNWCFGNVPAQGNFNGMTFNPVEACGDCLGANNIDKTCFWVKDGIPELLIRSRIRDSRGRKWFTNVEGDPRMRFNP